MADCGHLQEPVKHFIVKVHWLLLLWQEGLQNPQDLSCLHPNSKDLRLRDLCCKKCVLREMPL